MKKDVVRVEMDLKKIFLTPPNTAVARLLDRIEHPGQREILDRPLSAGLALREST